MLDFNTGAAINAAVYRGPVLTIDGENFMPGQIKNGLLGNTGTITVTLGAGL